MPAVNTPSAAPAATPEANNATARSSDHPEVDAFLESATVPVCVVGLCTAVFLQRAAGRTLRHTGNPVRDARGTNPSTNDLDWAFRTFATPSTSACNGLTNFDVVSDRRRGFQPAGCAGGCWPR